MIPHTPSFPVEDEKMDDNSANIAKLNNIILDIMVRQKKILDLCEKNQKHIEILQIQVDNNKN